MMNKAINYLVKAMVDSKTKFKNMFAHVLALFAMVFGSGVLTFTAANAANVANGITDDDNIATAYVFNIAAKTLTLSSQNTGSNDVLTIQTGAITDTAAGAIITAKTLATDDSTLTATVASVVLNNGAGAMTVTDVDTAPGIFTFNVSGVLTTDGTVTVTTLEDTDDENLVFDVGGALTVDGAFVLDAGGAGVTGNIEANLSNASINFNGGLVMHDISTTGLSNVSFDGGAVTTVAGTIDGGADNEGTIHVNTSSNRAVTFTGAIGQTNDVLLIDIDETAIFNEAVSAKGINVVASHDATFKKDVTAGATKFVNAGTISLAGTAAQTVTGAIESGTIDVENTAGTVTFTTALGVATIVTEIEMDANTTSVFNLVVDTTLVDLDGHMTVKENNNTATNFTLADGATLIIDDTIVNGEKVFLGSSSLVAASIVNTGNIKLPSNLSDGQTLEMFETVDNSSGVAAAVAVDTTAVLFDTAIRTYAASVTGTRDITVTVSDRSASAIGTQLGTNKNVGAALLQATIAATSNATLLDTFTNVLNVEGGTFTATTDTDLALQLAPQTETIGGSAVATRAMTGTVQGIVSNRMASLRSGDAFVTGMSAGNGMSANSGFIQAFGSESEQKNTGTTASKIYGYDAETSGVAIGFDGITDSGSTIGLSASYSTTDLDGKGTGKSKNSIDSYTVSVYADKATEVGYIEGSLTYGLNDNTSSRIVNTAGLDRTYAGSYDSEQISLKLGGGIPNEVMDGAFVTPFVSGTATQITTDKYTETSTTATDALRLSIAQDDISSLIGTIGVKAHMITDKGTPMISLSLNNEFGDNTISSQNTYTGGGTAFKTTTDVEELSATLGIGYSFGSDAASLNLNYEANANDDDYLSHYGTVKIIAKF